MAASSRIEDSERVPSATPDGIQKGRPHPALRKYSAHYEAVDAGTAMMRMQMRRSGEMGKIEGGLDDNSAAMFLDQDLLDTQGRIVVDPKGDRPPVPPDEARRVPRIRSDEVGSRTNPVRVAQVPSREELMSAPPGSVEASVNPSDDPFAKQAQKQQQQDSTRYDPFAPHVVSRPPQAQVNRISVDMSGFKEVFDEKRQEIEGLTRELADRDSRIKMLEARLGEAEGRLAEIDRSAGSSSVLSGFLSGRFKIRFGFGGMTFGVPVVKLCITRYGALVLMPDSDDSMSFSLDPMSDVRIMFGDNFSSYSDVAFLEAFDIPEIGLRAMAFVNKPGSQSDPAPWKTASPSAPMDDPYGGQSVSELVGKLVAS